jgi:hypothetical protein
MTLIPSSWTLFHYRDLFKQKQDYLKQFLVQYGKATDDPIFSVNPQQVTEKVR